MKDYEYSVVEAGEGYIVQCERGDEVLHFICECESRGFAELIAGLIEGMESVTELADRLVAVGDALQSETNERKLAENRAKHLEMQKDDIYRALEVARGHKASVAEAIWETIQVFKQAVGSNPKVIRMTGRVHTALKHEVEQILQPTGKTPGGWPDQVYGAEIQIVAGTQTFVMPMRDDKFTRRDIKV